VIDWGKHRQNPPPATDADDGYGPLAPRRRHDSVTNFRPSPFDEAPVTSARSLDEDAVQRAPQPPTSVTATGPRFVVRQAEFDARPSALTVPAAAPSHRTRSDLRAPLFSGTPEPQPIHQLPIFLGARGRLVSLAGEGAVRLRPSRTAVLALVAFAAVFIAVVLALRIGVLRSLQRAEAAMPILEPLPLPDPVPVPIAAPAPSVSASATASAKPHRHHRARPVEEEDEEDEAPATTKKKGAAGAAMEDDVDAALQLQNLARDQLENSLH
jgi:hypothetical protein